MVEQARVGFPELQTYTQTKTNRKSGKKGQTLCNLRVVKSESGSAMTVARAAGKKEWRVSI